MCTADNNLINKQNVCVSLSSHSCSLLDSDLFYFLSYSSNRFVAFLNRFYRPIFFEQQVQFASLICFIRSSTIFLYEDCSIQYFPVPSIANILTNFSGCLCANSLALSSYQTCLIVIFFPIFNLYIFIRYSSKRAYNLMF